MNCKELRHALSICPPNLKVQINIDAQQVDIAYAVWEPETLALILIPVVEAEVS